MNLLTRLHVRQFLAVISIVALSFTSYGQANYDAQFSEYHIAQVTSESFRGGDISVTRTELVTPSLSSFQSSSLVRRLISPLQDEQKLPVHQFIAALAEYKRGSITGAQVVVAFDLSAAEAASLQVWLTKFDTNELTREKVHDVLLLGEAGYYAEAKVLTELGL